MFFEQIFEEKLAQYAYLIGCQRSGEAIIVDPMRDVARYEKLAAKHNLEIVAALETHIHADYISGMREFGERGAKLYVSDEGDKDWKYEYVINGTYKHQLLKDGDEFSIGNIRFKAVHSPGHTPEHMSYLVTDGATTDEPMGIITGDFVFVGDLGRPDLLETAAGMAGVMEGSAKTLYKSLDRFRALPEYLQVWPGHGAGSACGKALGAVPDSTVGYELRFNASIKSAMTEQSFVDYILDGQPEPPLYFARMKRDNKLGPKVLGMLPVPKKMDVKEILNKQETTDAVILDTRVKDDFMAGHIKGSLFTPMNSQFNTIAGSYVVEGQDMYLIIEEYKIEEAVLDLIRIGLDNIVGYATPDELIKSGVVLESTKTLSYHEVDELLETGDYTLVDVRKASEYVEGHHPKAMNIAHTRLLDRMDEIPTEKPLVVHCQAGSRAAYASALLERFGHSVLFIDDNIEPWIAEHKYQVNH